MTRSSKISSPHFKRKTSHWVVKPPSYINLDSSSKEHQNEKTPSPPPRMKSLSPPQAPSKTISSKSTHYISSSSPSESLTPTHVAPTPKLCFVIPLKLKPQELPPLASSQKDPDVSTMDNCLVTVAVWWWLLDGGGLVVAVAVRWWQFGE
nr:hypothetical protein [Tanacetum cinerariifolium]